MKRSTIFIWFVLCPLLSFASSTLDSLLHVLDKAIDDHMIYTDIREKRIHDLKTKLQAKDLSPDSIYALNMGLYMEYRPYICDSAIYYLNRNLDIADVLNELDKQTETRLRLAYFLASTGMYKECMDVLDGVNRKTLNPKYLVDYYNTYGHVYGDMSFYSQDKRNSSRYAAISRTYKDSLYSVLTPDAKQYLRLKEYYWFSIGKIDDAMAINDERLAMTEMGTPEYAAITYYRSLYYSRKKNGEKRKEYLALSAISDIKASIRDNASLWALADSLYSNGDLNRAYNYIKFSLDNANAFNARLRSSQISGIQSIINKTYQMRSDQQKEKLRNYLIMISFLSVLLVIAVLFIYKQVKKVSVARNNLQAANEELKRMNLELSESNLVKEEYIGQSLTLCSTYINKLESFRKLIHRRITLGQTEEVFKLTRSEDFMEKEMKEFYTNFDNTFLHLYPTFVKEFNMLLTDDEQIVLKKGELLNAELRIFALIRLGIDDSSKIASFLGYSVNTIYNYRAKVKNKTRVSRDEFERYVMKIGAPSDK
ncbi:DUF6377 domain-containing protein [Bacteroides sp. 51]|uniref:DUF6377 domain-containing protein n=1 Tax=Bacteroides sp. 51 TaxID=2302938 RepID=UPI0013D36206|nr:DUF6377 domain-containing protein [Bacteroides sp. 51]NDV83986.1 transcriptional regulator [Bacteroides sp. 51]